MKTALIRLAGLAQAGFGLFVFTLLGEMYADGTYPAWFGAGTASPGSFLGRLLVEVMVVATAITWLVAGWRRMRQRPARNRA